MSATTYHLYTSLSHVSTIRTLLKAGQGWDYYLIGQVCESHITIQLPWRFSHRLALKQKENFMQGWSQLLEMFHTSGFGETSLGLGESSGFFTVCPPTPLLVPLCSRVLSWDSASWKSKILKLNINAKSSIEEVTLKYLHISGSRGRRLRGCCWGLASIYWLRVGMWGLQYKIIVKSIIYWLGGWSFQNSCVS